MNIYKALSELNMERKRIEREITRLEAQLSRFADTAHRSPRGRKSMPAEERLAVSRRMKEYWAKRRAPGAGPKRRSDSIC